jgi:glycine dehydrogenase
MTMPYRSLPFQNRHLGSSPEDQQSMLDACKAGSMEELISQTIPKEIRNTQPMNLPPALTEEEYAEEIKTIASKNKTFRSFIGMGYYDTITPGVILRNVLENPGWYTAYTPYQAEIAQGRLEALINYQTMVTDLTGLEVANASLLDEGTAAAEAVSMLYDARKGEKRRSAHAFFVSDDVHPQTKSVLRTRMEPLGIELRFGSVKDLDLTDPALFGILLQYPATDGLVRNDASLIEAASENDLFVVMATDLMALTLLKSPGELGADVAVGTAQRFGVPMGYGGPHAAFFATKEAFKRKIPGRIIGITKDAEGRPAYRMALQTREQHIRREKATSNICTAQVLLAVISGFYAVYHGAEGLRHIARNIHGMASLLAAGLRSAGYSIRHEAFFDTVCVDGLSASQIEAIRDRALEKQINLRFENDWIGISLDEKKRLGDVNDLLALFEAPAVQGPESSSINPNQNGDSNLSAMLRTDEILNLDVFKSYHTEHEMLRYMKRLENRDISLVHSMIPLGSCTMKLNATMEMIPLTWPEFGALHPFAPVDQAAGYMQMMEELRVWLSEITGFHTVSMQPNSGAQGEYSGLMVIRAYHHARGDEKRNVTIVPSSAHGTNPASAVMAGMEVVITKCDEKGNIDLADLREKAEQVSDRLAALMVTYPSTHGVFEEEIREICDLIHRHGGMVYMDGANMNAQVGLTSPAMIGADVCHLNLHKTFCIPHGGGGPGMGPIGVNEKLAPFLPSHDLIPTGGELGIDAVSAAPFGSASILTISHAYIRMMGAEGLKQATELAILNANYIKDRLKDHFPVLYTGTAGRSAHEFIIDLREFKKTAGIEAADVAKRLMDYGYHAPTMSFPVAGTLMIEPTESESKAELDRFCDVMISIREEIREIEEGRVDAENNVLKHAPHTMRVVMREDWDRPYSREKAVFPMEELRYHKIWPSVSRVDDAYGDRNLICTCAPIEEYMS